MSGFIDPASAYPSYAGADFRLELGRYGFKLTVNFNLQRDRMSIFQAAKTGKVLSRSSSAKSTLGNAFKSGSGSAFSKSVAGKAMTAAKKKEVSKALEKASRQTGAFKAKNAR